MGCSVGGDALRICCRPRCILTDKPVQARDMSSKVVDPLQSRLIAHPQENPVRRPSSIGY